MLVQGGITKEQAEHTWLLLFNHLCLTTSTFGISLHVVQCINFIRTRGQFDHSPIRLPTEIHVVKGIEIYGKLLQDVRHEIDTQTAIMAIYQAKIDYLMEAMRQIELARFT